MSTFYSVIFASVNPILSERLAIGLVLTDGQKRWFRYSKSKLSLMRGFFGNDAFRLLKTALRNIEIVASDQVNRVDKNYQHLHQTSDQQNPFTIDYLHYLSKYSNSTLTFTEPIKLDIYASDDLFNQLYSEFIFVEPELFKEKSEVELVKNKLEPRISKHVNWDYRVETGTIPGLIIPVDLDFIGKNDHPVVGKITDFNQPNYHLDASLSNIFVLIKTFEAQKEKGIYYIVGKEPDKHNKKQHQTWREVKDSSFLEFVHFDEIEQISEYMLQHSVEPYFHDRI